MLQVIRNVKKINRIEAESIEKSMKAEGAGLILRGVKISSTRVNRTEKLSRRKIEIIEKPRKLSGLSHFNPIGN